MSFCTMLFRSWLESGKKKESNRKNKIDYFTLELFFKNYQVRELLMHSLHAYFLNPKEMKYYLEIFANEITDSIKKSKFIW